MKSQASLETKPASELGKLARREPRKLGRLSRSEPRARARFIHTLTSTIKVKSATARGRGGGTRAWRGGDEGEAGPKSTSIASTRGRGAGDSSSPKATAGDDELNRPTDDEAAEATTRRWDDEATEPDTNPARDGLPWWLGRVGRARGIASPSTRVSAPITCWTMTCAERGCMRARLVAEARSAWAMPRVRATESACQANSATLGAPQPSRGLIFLEYG